MGRKRNYRQPSAETVRLRERVRELEALLQLHEQQNDQLQEEQRGGLHVEQEHRLRPKVHGDEITQSAQGEVTTQSPEPELELPDRIRALEEENRALRKEKRRMQREYENGRFRRTLLSTVGILIVVAAVAVLLAMLWVPVLRIYGTSMAPTLQNKEIVMALRYADFDTGDVIAFTYNNRILVKRVIAKEGDWVNLDEDGNVYINGELLEEPYLTDKAVGETDLEYPYQVQEGRIFVMGDNRETSIDSRHTSVGCVSEEQITGKLFLRVWPLSEFGRINNSHY